MSDFDQDYIDETITPGELSGGLDKRGSDARKLLIRRRIEDVLEERQFREEYGQD